MISSAQIVTRLTCFQCHFTGPLRQVKNVHQDSDICFQITKESLERSSIRILSRRHKKNKTTILKIIHRVTSKLPDSLWLSHRFKPLWSGVLVFDGKVVRVFNRAATKLNQEKFTEQELKWMHKMRWVCGVDYGTGDLPHYDLAEEESTIELVMYFKKLKELNYPLTVLVSDGNTEIIQAARFVYGENILHQLCTRHFIDGLGRLIPRESLLEQEKSELENLVSLIQQTIQAKSVEQAAHYVSEVDRHFKTCKSILASTIMTAFKANIKALTTHLSHPNKKIPRTSNEAEILFKQLNLRLRSLGRFSHWRYAKNYLNAWALLRRFTPFTDCRNGRKHRNGKAPLQLAGCEINNIDPIKLQS